MIPHRTPLFAAAFLLFSFSAQAQEGGIPDQILGPPVGEIPLHVLYAGIRPETDAVREVAGVLDDLLKTSLGSQPEVHLRTLDTASPIGDESAVDYLANCTVPMLMDCSVLLGRTSQDRFSVFGTVSQREEGAWAEVTLVDDENGWEALQVVAELGEEDVELFATQAGVVLRNEMERQILPRMQSSTAETDEGDDRALEARELATISWEKEGGFKGVRGHLREGRKPVTARDLEEKASRDSVTPWERLGMSSREYAHYRNSGLDLATWRDRAAGRKGQVLFRPTLGVGRAPLSERYLGQFARDPAVNLDVVEAYGFQEVQGAAGVLPGVSVGYGLTPTMEIEVGTAWGFGSYTVDVRQETVGQGVQPSSPMDLTNTTISFWGGVRVVPVPEARFRPVLGAGLAAWRGTGILNQVALPVAELPTFGAPLLLGPRVLGGGEMRLSRLADLCVQVPVDLLVAGTRRQYVDGELGFLTEKESPSPTPHIAVQLDASVQFRFGRKAPVPGPSVELEPDELEP